MSHIRRSRIRNVAKTGVKRSPSARFSVSHELGSAADQISIFYDSHLESARLRFSAVVTSGVKHAPSAVLK